MSYTQDLIDEVKELYPNNKEMHKHAKNGSAWLGRCLDDSVPCGISTKEVLASNDLEELKAQARLIDRKRELYSKWREQDPRNGQI